MEGQFAPEALDHEEVFNPRKRWHRVQQLFGQFWKRWRKEFLPSLNVRKKWFHPKHNLKEGDVVLVIEPKTSRGEWPLGCIIEARPGSDGLVRLVESKDEGEGVLTSSTPFVPPRVCRREFRGPTMMITTTKVDANTERRKRAE